MQLTEVLRMKTYWPVTVISVQAQDFPKSHQASILVTELIIHFAFQNFALAILFSFFAITRSDLDFFRHTVLCTFFSCLPVICLGSLRVLRISWVFLTLLKFYSPNVTSCWMWCFSIVLCRVLDWFLKLWTWNWDLSLRD